MAVEGVRHERLSPAAVLVPAAVAAPVLGVFAPLGIAPLLPLLAIAALAIDARRCIARLRGFAWLASLLAAVAVWAALTSLWSIIPGHSVFEAGRFLAISAAGLIVLGAALTAPPRERRWIAHAAGIGVLLAIAPLQIEVWSGRALWHAIHSVPATEPVLISRYDRGATLLLLASWPAAAALLRERQSWLLGLGVLLVAATLLLLKSLSTDLAALFGVLVLVAAARVPRAAIVVLVGGILALAFIFPFVAPQGPAIAQIQRALPVLRPSAIHRLVIWRFASDRIAERPLLGWGIDSARALPGGTARVTDVLPEISLDPAAQMMPLHPHDAALQWRLELGPVGVALGAAIIAMILWRAAGRRDTASWRGARALGLASSILTIALLSFGAWQAWWLCTAWLIAALMAVLEGDSEACDGIENVRC